MGRFASTAEFYLRFREPYPSAFFATVAGRIHLHGGEKLLDVGCGPGPLALGFAPFVRECVALDPEAVMVEAALTASARAGLKLEVQLGRIEDFKTDQTFDVLTIGRALHWLDRSATLEVFDRVVAERGRVLVCRASTIETSASPWSKPYEQVRDSWANAGDRERYRLKPQEWFSGSRFEEIDQVSVRQAQKVGVEGLIGRALSKSNTSPDTLGKRRSEFERELRAVLQPFAQNGVVEEEILAHAVIFGRRSG